MEPCGFVRDQRYEGVVAGRAAKRLRKRHRAGALCADPHATIGTMDRSLRARSGVLVTALALMAAACGPQTPSSAPASEALSSPSGAPSVSSSLSAATPSATSSSSGSAAPSASAAAATPSAPAPSVDGAAVYDEIRAQVVAIRGLKTTTVERETIDEVRLKSLIGADFEKDNPPAHVAATERLYKALGLMPQDQSLKALFLDLVGSQVAGFYRPDTRKLYVVSRTGRINGADKITFAHEYDHALQDAAFAVFKDQQELLDETDEALARAALYEGDATILMLLWAGPNLAPTEFQEVLAAGTEPAAVEILQRTPAIMRESLLFPYNAGSVFLTPLRASGGWSAIDAVYQDLPLSTEQILHPDKYAAGEVPAAIDIPANLAADMGSGWSIPWRTPSASSRLVSG